MTAQPGQFLYAPRHPLRVRGLQCLSVNVSMRWVGKRRKPDGRQSRTTPGMSLEQ